MKTLSFEDFVASKVEMTRKQFEITYGADNIEAPKVLVYFDHLYIEVLGSNKYYLMVERSEYIDSDLLKLEKILYEFGAHEYYVTPNFEKMNIKDTINKMFFKRDNYVTEIRKSEKENEEIFYIKLQSTDDVEHQVTLNRDSEYIEVKLEFPLSFLEQE